MLILLSLGISAYAQKNPGPRLVSMGSGGTAMQGVWSLQKNPAGIAGLRKPIFAVAYQQHGLDQDLSTQSVVFIVPQGSSALGLSLEKYGIESYTELQAGLSFARQFGDLRLAIGGNYYQLAVAQYGRLQAFSIEAGFQYNLTDKFTLASHLANPGMIGDKNAEESGLPLTLSFGLSYRMSEQLVMIADLRQGMAYPVELMTGMEYHRIKCLYLRGGISVNPLKQYCGFGLTVKRMSMDAAVSFQSGLGYAPQIALAYEF
jgi:hypothetical protein